MASRMILARSWCGVLISRLLLFTSRDAIANHLGILWTSSFRMRWDSGLKGAMLGSLMIDFGIRIIESSDVLVPERILEFSKLLFYSFPQDNLPWHSRINLKFDKYIINNETIVNSNQNTIEFNITTQGILKFRR